MIHPLTELKLVDDVIGYGVFATAFIPQGTIVYAQDALEIRVTPRQYLELNHEARAVVEKYSYIAPGGERVLSWDFAKYVNHRCDCNTMSTGWGFEIALRDIQPGEEITDDYGLFNLEYDMPVACGCFRCRKVVRQDDLDRYHRIWDRKVQRAMTRISQVEQPLLGHVDTGIWADVLSYIAGESPYLSVRTLKHELATERFTAEAVVA